MKALILAAGMGTRLGKYTENLPKGMLCFNGKPLIEWQIKQLKNAGINNINIVTGYMSEKINYPGLTYFHNPEFASTNMVESMLCAKEILDSDILITYSDVIFTCELVQASIQSETNVGVAVDRSWRKYWELRYGTTEFDLESLTVKDGKITELGKPLNSSEGIDYRYIGIIKFSKSGIEKALEVYYTKKFKSESWLQSGKSFKNGYMTDLLNELIITGNTIEPIIHDGGWLEFDTVDDYETVSRAFKEGKISSKFFE